MIFIYCMLLKVNFKVNLYSIFSHFCGEKRFLSVIQWTTYALAFSWNTFKLILILIFVLIFVLIDESGTSLPTNRKTKTFSEILNEKAKSGHRIGYNLHKYLDGELENENDIRFDINSRNYGKYYPFFSFN